MTTFAEQIAGHAQRRPDDPAVTCGDETLTFRELVDGAARMGAHFAAAGAGHGSLVTIGLPNGCAFAQATLGAWWIGATPAPVSHKLPAIERQAIIELQAPAVVVGVAQEDAADQVVLGLDALAEPIETTAPMAEPSPLWKAVTSGGSTGRPKVIVAQQPALFEGQQPLGMLLRMPTDETMLVPGPLSHNAPFAALSVGLLFGNHVVLMPRFDASECLRLAEEHQPRWLYQVPTMMLRIWRLDEGERLGRDLGSIDVVFHMAAPCPPWLKREWIDWLGAEKILELYGGTELQAITITDGTGWLAHPGSVGPVVLGEMEIRDESGAVLPAGEIGEVWMRRGADEPIPYSYIGAEARTASDNWESLGDNGHFDDDGFLHLADRSTDMIVVGGSNVYPAEIEAALDEHPAVRSSCVIGLPNEDLGNAPHALVELAEGVGDDELDAWLRERLAGYKLPKSFERISEPLRDDAGKVRRSQLRAARLPAPG